jgi:hypothetical protein
VKDIHTNQNYLFKGSVSNHKNKVTNASIANRPAKAQ